ncbi:protease, putative [Hepatocystis sp. ex Piliocolobus tephrosceles]|nr:protease, putative [Hepatocystis sp. ex Piliocolobus tephrosceles]
MYYKKLTTYDSEHEEAKCVKKNNFGQCVRRLYCFFSIFILIGFSYATNGYNGIFYFALSFAPSLAYLYIFRKQIKKEIKHSYVIEMVLYGAVLSIFSAGIFEYLLSDVCYYFCSICFIKEIEESYSFICSIFAFFYFFFVVAYVEEISKILPLIFVYVQRNKQEYIELPIVENDHYVNNITYEEDINESSIKKFKYITVNDKLEYIFFSLCSSAGFSSTENLFYVTQMKKQNFLFVIILRNLVCVLFHMCCTGISSYNIVNNICHKNKKRTISNLLFILGSIFSASLFHAVYDYSIYYISLDLPFYLFVYLSVLFIYSFFSVLVMFFVLIKESD